MRKFERAASGAPAANRGYDRFGKPVTLSRTTLRFEAGFGVLMRGAGVAMQQIDLYDSWFEPDALEEPIAFRRDDDPAVLTRLAICSATRRT